MSLLQPMLVSGLSDLTIPYKRLLMEKNWEIIIESLIAARGKSRVVVTLQKNV